MTFHPNFTQLGNLRIVETYEFYDKPLLFSCRNTAGYLFLAVLIDESEDGETWLYAPVSLNRYNQIRSGAIDLHDAFSNAEDGRLYRVYLPYNQTSDIKFEFLSINKLNEDALPLKGEKLSARVQTLPTATTSHELKVTAEQSLREQITLRLTLPNQNMTESPAELLGEILQRFQNLLTAVAASLRENVKAKSAGIFPQINVQGFAHSSFAVELASNESVDLFGDTEAGRALEQIIGLFEAGDNPEQIKLKIEQLKPKVAVGYALFLKALGTRVSGTQVDWASPRKGNTRSVSITSKQARNTIEVIERTELQPPERIFVSGTLIGANLRGKTFEIWAKEEGKRKKYSGRIDNDSIERVRGAGLGRDFRATLIQTLVINYTTGQAEPKYTLINLESL